MKHYFNKKSQFLLVLTLTSLCAYSQGNHDYFSFTIQGSTSICPNGTTNYTYSGPISELTWAINGGSFVGPNTGSSVTVTWTSSNGSLSASGTQEVCWYDPEIWPPVLYCDYDHYSSEYFEVAGQVTSYGLGGGTYCSGGSGVQVYLTGSQSGVTYQLKRDGVNVGSAIAGTGSQISWGNQTMAGTYTVVAVKSSTGCTIILGPSYVTVSPLPVAYSVTGGGNYCSGGSGLSINLSGSQTDVYYGLKLNGNGVAIQVSGTGSPMTWANRTTAGTYTITASSLYNCMQDMSGIVTVTVNPLPIAFSVGGGGSYCSGGSGVGVTLSGSQTGVTYQLRLNGSNTGAPLPGTGGGLTWSSQTNVGSYTVVATSSFGCTQTMSGSASVSVNSLPLLYNVGGGGSFCSGGSGVNITLGGSQSGVNYQLKLSGSATGAVKPGTGGILTWSSQTLGGPYTVEATYTPTGCFRLMTGTANITVNPLPTQYTVGGGGGYCTGGGGISITLSGSQSGVSYQLKVNGSNTGSPVSGTGSALTWNSQTAVGTYTVLAVNSSTTCFRTMSGSAAVSTNSLPTVYTVGGGGSYCSGGSGVSVNLNGSQTGVNYQLKVGGTNSGSAVAGTGSSLTWAGQTSAGTYTVVATNASTGCLQTMSSNAVVSINPLPTLYTVGGGGGYCTGGSGVSISLSGSQSGVSYQLKVNGSNTGSAVAGTGSPLSWNNQTIAGTYTILATLNSTGCFQTMSGGPAVTINGIPAITNNNAPVNYVTYGGNNVTLSTLSYQSYSWSRNGSPISGATGQSLVVKDPGNYTVTVGYPTGSCPSPAFVIYGSLANLTSAVNLVSTISIMKEGQNESSPLYSLNPNEIAQVVSYSDGLGRTFQTVAVGQSPSGGDVIAPVGYSRNGLMDSTYLPYSISVKEGRYRVNALRGTPANPATYNTGEQYLFYQNTAKVAQDGFPYARLVYRNTPDAKVTEQGAPGADWQLGSNHTVRHTMALNDGSTYRVRYWKADGSTSSDYAVNSVSVSITTDENNNKVRTFTDAIGRTVLKQVQLDETLEGVATPWLETYYIYDEFGQLIYQVPPKAMKVLGTGTTLDAKSSTVAEFIYQNKYDSLGRVKEKKIPGAVTEYIVYDKYNRVTFIQDGDLKSQNKWSFIKYDRFNRPVYTGIYSRNVTRAVLQAEMNARNYDTEAFFETEQVNSAYQGYSNTVYPTTDLTVLTANYYDHYDFDRNTIADFNFDNTQIAGQQITASSKTRGLPTGSKKVIIDGTGIITPNWLIDAVFYDQFDRPIQTQTNNHLYQGAVDVQSVVYDFSGKALKTRSAHSPSATTTIVLQNQSKYDHTGRILSIQQSIGEPVKWVSPVNVTITGSTLTKSGGTNNTWDAGAFSSNNIPANQDGWVEFIVDNTNTYRMLGLSDQDINASYNTIDYALYIHTNGEIYIYENGNYIGMFGNYVVTDAFRVERIKGVVHYKKNGVTFYRSLTSSTSILYADASIYSSSSKLINATLGIGQADVQIASYEYNALGQLVDKKLVGNENNYLQSIDYRYNIRGWLTSLNNGQLDVDNSNDDTNDLFGMELLYNSIDAGLGNASYYNGNISAVKWKSPIAGGAANDDRKSYKYTYDKSDRLKQSTYQGYKLSAANWTSETGAFNEAMTYDHNGNIKTLQRKKPGAGASAFSITPATIDDLDYTYANGNQLSKVEDLSANAQGFKNAANITTEYSYNPDGSLTKDENKGISSITYNVLGQPQQMTFSDGKQIKYSYDASGNKLKMEVVSGSTTTTDYVGSFVYENSNLTFLGSPEGRVVKNGAAYEYQFALADHQGNTRALFGNAFEGSNLISDNDCNTTSGFPANQNVTVTVITLSGETYVKGVTNQSTSSPGIWPIGGTMTVSQGEKYTFKVKGYRDNSPAYLYIWGNTGDLVWTGSALPIGASNEGWVSSDVTIPSGVTQVKLGVLFSNPTIGSAFYLNKVAFFKFKDDDVPAGFEVANQGTEGAMFDHYNTSKINNTSTYATTGTSSYRLTGSTAISGEVIGVAKSIRVYTGDVVNLQVYGRYLSTTGSGTNVGGVIAGALQAAFGLSAGGTTDVPFQSVGNLFSGGALIGTVGYPYEDNAPPKAFLNYILFDDNYVPYDFGYDQINGSAALPSGAADKMSLMAKVRKPGYIYIYLSNENPVAQEVYFDDLSIKHVKSPVIQQSEYYAFGMQTVNSWSRENNTGNNFLGNGGTELNQTSSLYDLAYRNYDPVLGRMNGVDPVAGKYSSLTPYNYAFNDPVSLNDPSGADPYSGYYEGAEPIFEEYTGMMYNFGTGSWVQDDKIMYRLTGWRGPVARYAGPGLDWMFGKGGLSDWRETTFGGISMPGGMSLGSFLNSALGSSFGGSWSNGQGTLFTSDAQGLQAAYSYANEHNSWGSTAFGSLPTEGRKLAVHNYYGDFVQLSADGNVYVPYTNISYWEHIAGKVWFPAQSKKAKSNSFAINAIHTSLDVLGMVPLLGEVADGLNAGIYALRGDYVNAGISAAAMVPLVGSVGTGSRLGYKVYQAVDAAGIVKYVGITSQNLSMRVAQHMSDPNKIGLKFYELGGDLTKLDARIWEQTLINQYGLGKKGGQLLNQINSIAPSNWLMYGIKP